MTIRADIPVARPFGPELETAPAARASGDAAHVEGLPPSTPFPGPPPAPAFQTDVPSTVPARTEPAAVAAAVCGMSAVIPIVSQIAGLFLGFLALGRIARARRAGVILGGRRYALTGIVSSGLALAGWLAFGALMFGVNKTLAHTLKPLSTLQAIHR